MSGYGHRRSVKRVDLVLVALLAGLLGALRRHPDADGDGTTLEDEVQGCNGESMGCFLCAQLWKLMGSVVKYQTSQATRLRTWP